MNRPNLFVCTLSLILSAAAMAEGPVSVKLWRLDCGTLQADDLNAYSDTFAYFGKSRRFPVSCYLIKHADTYMLWDAGLPDEDLGLPLAGSGSKGESLSKTLPDQLTILGIQPQQIGIIGISHYHTDHTGQAHHFPQARLLMGKGDITALRAPGNFRAKALVNWLGGEGRMEEVVGDKDVFEDQTVIMLDLPGHTPGHHGLLIKLGKKGYVLLSGDVAHFRENYLSDGVPTFNVDRSESLASLGRFKGIAKNLHATVIIEHDERDIGKLPLFPDSAR